MSDQTFTQADVDRIVGERLAAAKAKADERINALNESLKAAEARAAQFEADAKRASALDAELTGIKTAAERAAAWDAAGVPAEARARLERLYTADTADAPATLAEWLEANKEDPVVSRFLPDAGGSQPPPSAPGTGTQQPPASRVPATAGAQAPGRMEPPKADALRAQHRELLTAGKVTEAREVLAQIKALG